MKISERSKRFAGILETKIPPLIQKFFTPDQIGFVTVTAVEVSGDLKVVDIFVRSLNGPVNFCKKLNKLDKKFSHELSQILKARQSLIIRFKEDKSVKAVEVANKNLK